jgi:signal transduction histidine kinase
MTTYDYDLPRHKGATMEERIRIMTAREQGKQLLEMMGNIAHEWRQPLNLISLLIQDFKESYDEGKFTKEYLDDSINKVMDVIQYMSQTMQDFSNFFIPGKAKTLFSVRDSINRTVSFLNPALKRSNILVQVDVPDDFLLNGYPNEYSHVLLNIIENAKDVLSERNTTEPRIIIRAFQEAEKVVVSITDNAGGIPENIIDKIFDRYFTTKSRENGIGIGLDMSKIIIEEKMGGKLSARNIKDGAEFRIEI